MKVILVLLLACIVAAYGREYTTRTVIEDTEAVRQYWTEERLNSAVDRDLLVREGEPEPQPFDAASDFTPLDAPEPVYVDGHDSLFFPTVGSNNHTESEHAKRYPFPYSSGFAPSYTTYPWRTVGKVFFTLGGGNFVCSAAVIHTNVVHTAGHCVFDPAIGVVSNFIFIAGYNNGLQPYGSWTAFQIHLPTDWQLHGSFCRDYAAVVLRRNNGASIGNVVGTLGYAYGQSYSQTWRSLGYPAAAPFNGMVNYYADSAIGVQDLRCGGRCNAVCTPSTIGIGSDATGGASGGPWILNFSPNVGPFNHLNGVNSYKYNNQPAALYGPYFDQAWFNVISPSFTVSPP